MKWPKQFLSPLLGALILIAPVVLPTMAPVDVPLLSSEALAASTAVMESAAGAPGKRLVTTQFLVSGTYTPTSNLIWITGSGCGSGGAGGNATGGVGPGDPGGGGGGGSGSQSIVRMPVVVTPGTALTITICTAGVGGAAGAVGGTTNLDTTIAGLPIGTYTIMGGRKHANVVNALLLVPQAGTITVGGSGGAQGFTAGGVGTTTTAGACGGPSSRAAGGDFGPTHFSGSAGGGPSTAGGACAAYTSGYNSETSMIVAAASGTKGGGGIGGMSAFTLSPGLGGSNAAGGNCTGYGGGGGGGAATFAGGNGCPGMVSIDEWK